MYLSYMCTANHTHCVLPQVLLAEAQAKLGGMKVKVPCNNENKSDADEDEDEESDVATSSEKTIFSPGKRMNAGED